MKVAIVHNQFSSGGGMEAYMSALIRGFLAAGDEVHIHTYEVDRALAARLPCILHKSNLFFLPRRWKKYWFLWQCNRHFDRNAYDLSLGLTRTFGPDIAVIGGIHPASVAASPGRNYFLRRFHDRIETGLERTMFARTPRILAHSKAIAGEIEAYYSSTDPGKISVLYPPIDTDFFRPVQGDELIEARKRYGLDSAKMTLLFPSLGHRRKGLEELLTAFRQLDPDRFELLIVGERVRGFTDFPGAVRYLGYIENLSELYTAVDYTVLPSYYEPFGLAVVESLQCSTPVLVTSTVGAAELLSPDEGVVLDDNNPAALACAIEKLEKKTVEPGFVQRHGLSLCQHIEQLKALVQ
ncbi:MAG: glycosyltransferase family 4 protein [Desulfobulbaceae bacterium]|nr:glycosyltransferase family 4 protein [Desulfobulbaceae bacterium]